MADRGEITEEMNFSTPDVPTLPIDAGNGSDCGITTEPIASHDRHELPECDGEATEPVLQECEARASFATSEGAVGQDPSLDGTVTGSPVEPASDETAAYPGFLAGGKTPIEVPGTLGRYRVIRLLGEGGCARVYQGFDADRIKESESRPSWAIGTA